jgi:hypothetical protein
METVLPEYLDCFYAVCELPARDTADTYRMLEAPKKNVLTAESPVSTLRVLQGQKASRFS